MPYRKLTTRPISLAALLAWIAVGLGCRQDSKTPVPPVRSQKTAKSLGTTAISLSPHQRNEANHINAIANLAIKQATDQDNWSSESLAEWASQQLGELAHLPFDQSRDQVVAAFHLVVAKDAITENVRSMDWQSHYSDSIIQVARTGPSTAGATPPSSSESLLDWMHSLHDSQGRIKFKIVQIDVADDSFTTLVRTEIYLPSESSVRQQTMHWTCRWTLPTENRTAPQVQRIDIADAEQVTSQVPDRIQFQDVTANVLSGNESYSQQMLPGIPEWMNTAPKEFMSQFGYHGMAVGDVNGDGLDDIYVCDAGGLPNRLYVQQSDGTAKDMSAAAGVDFLDDSVGALLIDLDNDGDQDLVVGVDPVLQIAENDGQGNFTRRRSISLNTESFSLAAADFDQDGLTDIYVCGYNLRKKDPTDRGLPFPVPYFDATNGGRNFLLRNVGQFEFSDVTSQVGLDQNNNRFSMAAAWQDFDNDGDQDLYVANDFGRNNLYRNDGGKFQDIANQANVEDHASGMSVAWADYDRDGHMDLYVGNMFSAAGNRITYQRQFAPQANPRAVNWMQRMARGNTLFAARPDGSFDDVSETLGVNMGRWAWSSCFADINNDGWQDLVIANGYFTNQKVDDL
ncbi:MAG: VCBS repeat-containing protein [Planctomycetales bacterium]|nr:VCBS repeat-containing protein [Planctomycetales bacterium]